MKHWFFSLFLLATTTIAAQSRWMTALSDTLPMSRISIPGAHDAATASLRGRGRCQTLTLTEQLAVGVRAFDLRPTQQRRTKKLGNIHHGLKSTRMSLAEAFDEFNAFLEKNPGEAIIVLLRDESDGRYLFNKPRRETFTAALREFLRTQPRIVNFRPDLRLRDCRGGIIVLCRTGSPADKAATYLTWNHSIDGNCDRRIHYAENRATPLAVQDCYAPKMAGKNVSDEDFLQLKLSAAEKFLAYAATARATWVINHASAYVGRTNYCRHAAHINPRLARCLSPESPDAKKSVGIVMMDFAGATRAKFRGKAYPVVGDTLLRAVIATNYL